MFSRPYCQLTMNYIDNLMRIRGPFVSLIQKKKWVWKIQIIIQKKKWIWKIQIMRLKSLLAGLCLIISVIKLQQTYWKFFIIHVIPDLPNDSRTLLGTNKIIKCTTLAGEDYFYFGVQYWLEKYVNLMGANILHININIDGIPLFKSSTTSLWPILACISDNHEIFFICLKWNKVCK